LHDSDGTESRVRKIPNINGSSINGNNINGSNINGSNTAAETSFKVGQIRNTVGESKVFYSSSVL
jgi:hypothetical protein